MTDNHDFDESGNLLPPWIQLPDLPYGSIGWRMGSGEYVIDNFKEWYGSLPRLARKAFRAHYPEPDAWKGFFSRIRSETVMRYLAGIRGALVGDALGVPFEFKQPVDIPPASEIRMVMQSAFRKTYPQIPYGTWSDDGSQLLCLLESLEHDTSFDPAHFATLLVKWARAGHHQSGGAVFDCGGQTARALQNLENGVAPLDAGGTEERSNGNGSLMRVLPVALVGHWDDWSDQRIVDVAHLQSRLTHRHPVAQVCCALYCLVAIFLLRDGQRKPIDCRTAAFSFLDDIYGQPEYWEFQGALAIVREFPQQNFKRGSGYVVDCLWSALDCLENSHSYVETVRAAILLGNDTDTTACVAGGLAGIIYGAETIFELDDGPMGIPCDWIAQLRVPDVTAELLDRIM